MTQVDVINDTVLPPAAAPAWWSLVAIASFACGLLLFVPFLAGIAALTLGILGLRQTATTSMRGRKLAIAGAVLGLVNLVGWFATCEFVAAISAPGRAVAHRFVSDLNSGDLADAQTQCTESIGGDQLSNAADEIRNWGGAKHVVILYVTADTTNGLTAGSIRGTLHTPTGAHRFQFHTIGSDNGWKISDFSMQ
jgi:hypothetical protein